MTFISAYLQNDGRYTDVYVLVTFFFCSTKLIHSLRFNVTCKNMLAVFFLLVILDEISLNGISRKCQLIEFMMRRMDNDAYFLVPYILML